MEPPGFNTLPTSSADFSRAFLSPKHGPVSHVEGADPQSNRLGALSGGFVVKAGASFFEAFAAPGSGSTLVCQRSASFTAIDGLRKAQSEEKPGSKGALTSTGGRLLGKLAVERKDLFHSIKAGLHATHAWLTLITNRVALAISAALWWGGEEPHTLLSSDCATAKAEAVEAWHDIPAEDLSFSPHPSRCLLQPGPGVGCRRGL